MEHIAKFWSWLADYGCLFPPQDTNEKFCINKMDNMIYTLQSLYIIRRRKRDIYGVIAKKDCENLVYDPEDLFPYYFGDDNISIYEYIENELPEPYKIMSLHQFLQENPNAQKLI